MGLQPWEDVDGNPRMNPKANSCGIDKYYPYGPMCVELMASESTRT